METEDLRQELWERQRADRCATPKMDRPAEPRPSIKDLLNGDPDRRREFDLFLE